MSQPQQPRPAENPTPQEQPKSRRPKALSAGRAIVLLVVLVVLAGLLAGSGIITRIHARTNVADNTNALAAPSVIVNPPTQGQPQQEVVLPGNLEAYTDSPIYARTNGYLKKWYFDIGAHVRKGQLLADIESPEIDQQLAQAQADLATAQTNAGNAQTQSTRYQDLLKTDSVSKLDTDNFTTQANAASTTVKSALANVQRLQQLVGFEKVFAPFDGVVTARNTDIGQLINAGAGTGTPLTELFHLAASQTLRLYVNVPQIYSQNLKPGMTADLTFNEFPGRKFVGRLVRTSRQIDPTSRTLLVEFDVNNRTGELFPGAYTEVHFKTNSNAPSFIVPVSALMFRSEGLRVAVVAEDNKAKLVPVILGRDDGATVQVIHGLAADSRVIQDPPDSLIDGENVQIVKPANPSGGGAGAGGGQSAGAQGGKK
ncbi:putative Co/Zn/Cd efflux system membrane fusion protein [Acidisarcina polymorpha]|uniref:Putative Co/Zn/Cd efflux system membrane fusion protein n=1 Tax=Acidisarcina polymorpha TaxID=2211140 RepID=A0A2Z5FVL9_9BACT|nr:efflux RND transporter periplasmic adaptor subunit [Acidisarcina polymorpha]AXC10939.1 putative Co/Zn/Cd efflux system membrane fusion protein [Acidisarcina polymorpha]